jgi:hypothetical protein
MLPPMEHYIEEIVKEGMEAFASGINTVEAAKASNPYRAFAFRKKVGHKKYVSWNHGWNLAFQETVGDRR